MYLSMMYSYLQAGLVLLEYDTPVETISVLAEKRSNVSELAGLPHQMEHRVSHTS